MFQSRLCTILARCVVDLLSLLWQTLPPVLSVLLSGLSAFVWRGKVCAVFALTRRPSSAGTLAAVDIVSAVKACAAGSGA
jgi:hypothetical protein